MTLCGFVLPSGNSEPSPVPLGRICLDKGRGFQRNVHAGATSVQAGPCQDSLEGIRPSGLGSVGGRTTRPSRGCTTRLCAVQTRDPQTRRGTKPLSYLRCAPQRNASKHCGPSILRGKSRQQAAVEMATGVCTRPRGMEISRRRDCHSAAAPPSPFSKCFNIDGKGVSAK